MLKTKNYLISIQNEDFEIENLSEFLKGTNSIGAIVHFIGLVRDYFSDSDGAIQAIKLECYDEMAYLHIEKIVNQALEKFSIDKVVVAHRKGKLNAGEQIVFVGVNSAHRKAAFDACVFIMDYLKIKATFWKKELGDYKASWVKQHN